MEEVVKKQTELLRRIAKSGEHIQFLKEIEAALEKLNKTAPVSWDPIPLTPPYGMLFTLPIPIPSPKFDPIPLPFPRLQTLKTKRTTRARERSSNGDVG